VLRRAVLVLVVLTGLSLVPAIPAGAAARPSAGTRIVQIAKRYVHHARYVYGGASPRRGFDCSGYVKYVYKKAHVARLPHNAQAQRHARHMHQVSRRHARPGDLVFYLSGHHAYHVAIYAGHGRQYSAATPRDGIRYQKIWSRHVEFRTDWH
jgi:cell wall-associated NlpC family hydrolase